MAERDYRAEAQDDAAYFVEEELSPSIIDQILEDGEASKDIHNDYDGADQTHHERNVDKNWTMKEAFQIILQLEDFEESDEGLWQGQSFEAAAETKAAFTYAKAVAASVESIIEAINNDVDELPVDDDGNYKRADVEALVEKHVASHKLANKPNPLTIEIVETANTTGDMVDILRRIADLVEQGFTSGYEPEWSLSGEEQEEAA